MYVGYQASGVVVVVVVVVICKKGGGAFTVVGGEGGGERTGAGAWITSIIFSSFAQCPFTVVYPAHLSAW